MFSRGREEMAMAPKQPRKMKLGELMSRLGDAEPGSIAHPSLEAEFKRRKFVLAAWAVVVTGAGVTLGFLYQLGLFPNLGRFLKGIFPV
jgi:hypothetical protein